MDNEYYVDPIILNSTDIEPPLFDGGIFENRQKAYYKYNASDVPKCSFFILGYNRFEKTKYCVECVLKYAADMDYELILVDNGSSDGTYDFFQSVPHRRKTVIRVEKNIGAGFPGQYVLDIYKGKYLVSIPNDVYITENSLQNLIFCMESDPSVGIVNPMASNVSNLQEVDLGFKTFDEMQRKAALFNRRDPSKWEERMRIITLLTINRREVTDVVGLGDPAFIHDFVEDDICARIRRAGYKIILCGDTYVCHDHDFRNMEDKDPVAFKQSLESGRAIYREKYHGIDAWDDIMNFEHALLSSLNTAALNKEKLAALCIDIRCGTPVLEIRNRLRKRGRTDVTSYAFTTQAKYFVDLQSVAAEVRCDRIEFIQEHYADNSFDIIALGEPINTYASPVTLLQRLYGFLKPRGILTVKLRNTDDYNSFLRSAGLGGIHDPELPANLPLNEVVKCLELFGGQKTAISAEMNQLSRQDQQTLLSMLKKVNPNANEKNDLSRLMIANYVLQVTKK